MTEIALKDVSPSRRQFLRDVLRGLSRPRKRLPCKYFYDERGSRLFEQICQLDEYYPTRTELGIMRQYARQMADCAGENCVLVEYGSGSSTKTRTLLDHLDKPAAYVPVDISKDHLSESAAALSRRYPDLAILPVCADFTHPFQLPVIEPSHDRTVVYFPGSTIGNFGPRKAVRLLGDIADLTGAGGGLLIGVDLRKSPDVLQSAYNDSAGITAAFNLNLLARINRELDADFRLDRFRHRAHYDSRKGRVEMHLYSLEDQTVTIDGREFQFAEGESIHTENSHKYTLKGFERLAAQAGLTVERVWTDPNDLFSVQYLAIC